MSQLCNLKAQSKKEEIINNFFNELDILENEIGSNINYDIYHITLTIKFFEIIDTNPYRENIDYFYETFNFFLKYLITQLRNNVCNHPMERKDKYSVYTEKINKIQELLAE